MAKPKQAPNNPFACESNAVKMHTVGACCGTLLATYSYAVSNGGATTELTALTGQSTPGLEYYRWNIYDKFGNVTGGAIDVNDPNTPVNVDTSSLSTAGDWKIKFSAAAKDGQEEKSISYDLIVSNIASNPSGTSTPSNYENVILLLTLNASDDANYTAAFPAEGVEIKAGDTLQLDDFAFLVQNKAYSFNLSAKKYWYSPAAEQPAFGGGGVVQAVTPEAAYPISLDFSYAQILGDIQLKTSALGNFQDTVTVDLQNEGVQPSISFTLKTKISA
jgi:hypothetical protein